MKQTDLEKLLADMSLKEKVDQMLQLSGAFYLGDENSVLTGPANDMGIGKEDLEIFTIDSKKYAFNTAGEMQTGKQSIRLSDGTAANYYFDEEGIMKTGKQTIYDEDLGETQNWLFHAEGSKKGQGYHGIKDNTLYVNGLRQEADKDLRFAPVSLDDTRYLVNVNGAVQKAGSTSKSASRPELGSGYKDFKDENDMIWTVNTEGIIQ